MSENQSSVWVSVSARISDRQGSIESNKEGKEKDGNGGGRQLVVAAASPKWGCVVILFFHK